MKKQKNRITLALSIAALMFFASCSKQEDNKAGSNNPASSQTQQEKNIAKIKKLVGKLPIMKVLNMQAASHRNAHPNSILDPGFSFADPNSGGMHFSTPTGVTYTTSGTSTTFSVPASSFGINSSSAGNVTAGVTSLNINYTFCFNSSGTAIGLDLFKIGATFTGVSAVVGVAGDFAAIANHSTDSTTSFADLFQGFAFYIVYDGVASGSYDVIDWQNTDLGDTTATDRKCFAFVIDFRSGHLYMSSSGTINVTGGSMNFNGQYLDLGGIDLLTFNTDSPDLTISTVAGFGVMGCN